MSTGNFITTAVGALLGYYVVAHRMKTRKTV